MILKDNLRAGSVLGIDTTPLIYLVENHVDYFDKMFFIMTAIANRQISAISTMLTLTEVLTHPLRMANTPLVQKYQSILNNSIGFELIPLNKAIAYKAAELRAQYTLKTPDAIQVATAIVHGCDIFLTNDKGLKRITDIQVWVLDELSLS